MITSKVKTKDGVEEITAYSVEEVRLPLLLFKWVVRNRKKAYFASDFMVLDTETSHSDDEHSWIYQWAVKIKNTYIYGRTPEEFLYLLRKMAEWYKLRKERSIMLYIHNASYDLQYLKHYLRKYDPFIEVTTTDTHSVLFCNVLGFKICCSYRLTNLSLDMLSKNYAEKYRKAVGEIDYTKIRYQDTELNEDDWFYMFSDVASQMDGIKGYLKSMGFDYAYKAPLTSTGFVRLTCREASNDEDGWREEFNRSALDLEMYNLCKWAFMGGVCISSFVYSGETIRGNLGHDDFTSSYPARQCMNYAPVGAPSWYGEVETREEFYTLLEDYCCVFVLTINNVKIKKGITAPCIPSSKCVGLSGAVKLNGKIVKANSLTIAITEIDFKWIRKQYDFDKDFVVDKMLIFERGRFPKFLREEALKYFRVKCTLKHSDPILYMASKVRLNALYGMMATALIRDEYEMDDDLIYEPKKYFSKDTPIEKQEEILKDVRQKALNKYYNSRNSFLPYQLSLYTTAWARDALYTMIETVGYENFLYCDTDSVFYINTPEVEKRMDAYRESCRKRAIENGTYVDNYYLGMPTKEPKIRAFRGLHAKCYAMEQWDEDKNDFALEVVIAGIPKKSLKWVDGKPVTMTNAEELGSIDNLVDDFTFTHNGGTRCIYVEQEPTIETINGHVIQLASSAITENIEKHISDNMWCEENGFLLDMHENQVLE